MLMGGRDGCIIQIITKGATYGYDKTRRLNAMGFKDIVDGTVYTVLLRLEKNRLVNIEKKPSEIGPPRKFFTLNAERHKELIRFWAKWEFIEARLNELREEKQ
jgi:DNA-binding PadR family transcriptional regulator